MSRRGVRRKWTQTNEHDYDVRAVWFGYGALIGAVAASCGWVLLLVAGR